MHEISFVKCEKEKKCLCYCIPRGVALYLLALFAVVLLLVCVVGPRWGQRSPFVYIGITACLGSVTVMCCIALGIGFTQSFVQVEAYVRRRWGNWSAFSERVAHFVQLTAAASAAKGGAGAATMYDKPPVLLVVALVLITGVCIVLQLYYLNRALDLFSVNLVTPLLYVFFTIAVLALSAILFDEWGKLTFTALSSILCGFANIVFGIFLLSCFKHLDVGLLLFAMDSKRAAAAAGGDFDAVSSSAASPDADRDDLSTWKHLLHMMAFGGDLPGGTQLQKSTKSAATQHEQLPPPRESARSEVSNPTQKAKTKAVIAAPTPFTYLGSDDNFCSSASGSNHIEAATYGSLNEKSTPSCFIREMNEIRLNQLTAE